MVDELKEDKKAEVMLTEIEPTLFIALGGTGAEVLWRVRRRILNSLWGSSAQPVRLGNLTEFPFAEFLQIDLDMNTVSEQGKAQKSDILSDKIRFKEEERLVKKLDLGKYIKTDEELAKYPIVQEWFPLSRSKVNELNINPEKGAGQIRALSRLYFFDKYQEIKAAVRGKAEHLQANVSSAELQKRLGLKVQTGTLKIVVVASTAGGTGSGSFLDLGYLAQIIGKQAASQKVSVNLILMLPTGYMGANRSRTQANTYAALMELETSMKQGGRYIKGWSESEIIRDMPENPYNDVYLVDTANLASAQTEDIKDTYDMIADALFEDFSTADFANRKRSISVNQNQHKTVPYQARVDRVTYGNMVLPFSRAYSAFGQATIDIHLDQKRNIVLFRQVNEMLKAFFGVAASDQKSNMPTEAERDELLANRMHLGVDNDIIEYDFVVETEFYRKGAERTTYPLVTELLRVNGISRLDDIEKQINDKFEEVRTGGNYKEWPAKIAALITQINHDAFKAVESGSGLHEDAIRKRRAVILTELLNAEREHGLIRVLWARVDNKERGGLDYTIELIRRVKDRLENANTGLIKALEENAKWFSDLSGHLRNEETTKLQEHLNQAISKLIGGQGQAEQKLKQITDAVRLYVRYHLYAAASSEAAKLVQELSDGLGKQRGTDVDGNPIWEGFIGEMEAGRNLVRSIVGEAEDQILRTSEAMKQGHAMYFVLPAPKSKIDELELLPPTKAREWAEEAFLDFGGTQDLFAMLRDDDGRAELLGKLRNRSLQMVGEEDKGPEDNPLFAALDQHQSLGQLFGDFLQRAMPWVAARVEKYLKETDPNDQYKCFIGVKDARKFESKYGALLRSRLPTATMMTAKEISFVEIDTPGKVVCYTELSGLPLPSLKALDDWYTAYREEGKKIPVHTHRRKSTFVHPREMTTDELAARVEDFKLFVQAVALGVLTRTEKGEDAGLYKIRVKGASRSVGDEKVVRLEGFPPEYRAQIQQQVEMDCERLTSQDQLVLWIVLLEYYAGEVYPVNVVKDEMGTDQERKSLPTLLCEKLVEEWTARIESKLGADQSQRLIYSMRGALRQWSDEIPSSTTDVYRDELYKEIKPKRVLRQDVLKEGWQAGGQRVMQPSAIHSQAPIQVPPVVQVTYYVAVDGKQTGPHQSEKLQDMIGQGLLTPETKVWKAGMSGWERAGGVKDLEGFFTMPPPLDDGPPPL